MAHQHSHTHRPTLQLIFQRPVWRNRRRAIPWQPSRPSHIRELKTSNALCISLARVTGVCQKPTATSRQLGTVPPHSLSPT